MCNVYSTVPFFTLFMFLTSLFMLVCSFMFVASDTGTYFWPTMQCALPDHLRAKDLAISCHNQEMWGVEEVWTCIQMAPYLKKPRAEVIYVQKENKQNTESDTSTVNPPESHHHRSNMMTHLQGFKHVQLPLKTQYLSKQMEVQHLARIPPINIK